VLFQPAPDGGGIEPQKSANFDVRDASLEYEAPHVANGRAQRSCDTVNVEERLDATHRCSSARQAMAASAPGAAILGRHVLGAAGDASDVSAT